MARVLGREGPEHPVGRGPVAALQRPTTLPSIGALGAVAILGVVCTAAAVMLFGVAS